MAKFSRQAVPPYAYFAGATLLFQCAILYLYTSSVHWHHLTDSQLHSSGVAVSSAEQQVPRKLVTFTLKDGATDR